MSYKVFISHAGSNIWLAWKLSQDAEAAGADCFLDQKDIFVGEDFEDRILGNLCDADEFWVLLTPESLARPYVWMEVGTIWRREQLQGPKVQVVSLLYGITAEEVQQDTTIPTLLKTQEMLQLNEIEQYKCFLQEFNGRAAPPHVPAKNSVHTVGAKEWVAG